jgi:hypothetical protein
VANPDPGNGNTDPAFEVMAHPNPFNHDVNFTFTSSERTEVEVELFDSRGARITGLLTQVVEANETTTVNIPTAHLAPGVYLYRIVAGETIEAGKLVLVR